MTEANKIKIAVVDHKGERLFKADWLLFDQLFADDGFRKLTIVRDGEVLDETTRIEYHGTHAATWCFLGLKRLFSEEADPMNWIRADAVMHLLPEEFEVGDELILSLRRGFNFFQHITGLAVGLDVLHNVMKKRPEGISLGELDKELPREAVRTKRRMRKEEVVRFRSRKR